MMTVVGYQIVWSNDSDKLCLEVYRLLERGYVPLGSPYVKGDYHYQAMVEYGKSTIG